MSKTNWITAAVLVVVLAIIVVALLAQAASGPSFRAGDYDTYEECLQNIPQAWGPGTLERGGAEDACYYVHRRDRGR